MEPLDVRNLVIYKTPRHGQAEIVGIREFHVAKALLEGHQEELSQLLPSQWGMVHLFDLCLRFGHADTALALARHGVPGCVLEDHHNLGPFCRDPSVRQGYGPRICRCQSGDTCGYCCWAFPVEQGIWMEDWDVDLGRAVGAAREAAATPLTCATLDISSRDMEVPFQPKTMARLLDVAILTGNRKAAMNLSKKCQLWPLRRWAMDWDFDECWEAARTALWAGADFQDLIVKYFSENVPFQQGCFLRSELEDWEEICHFLPRCHRLWSPRNHHNALGNVFFDHSHRPGDTLKLSLGRIRAAQDAGVDVRFFFVEVFWRDEDDWPAFVTLLDVAIWCGQPDWAEACVDGGIELKEGDDGALDWHKGILGGRSWARKKPIIASGRHGGEIHVVPSKAKIAAAAATRAWLKRLRKNTGIVLYQMFKRRLLVVQKILSFTTPKIVDQLDLWAHVGDWMATSCGPSRRMASRPGG